MMNNKEKSITHILDEALQSKAISSIVLVQNYWQVITDDGTTLSIYSAPHLLDDCGTDRINETLSLQSLIGHTISEVSEDAYHYRVSIMNGLLLKFKKKGTLNGVSGAIDGEDF